MTLLKIKNLSVKYGRKLALQNIELELNSNEIVTIVGPNGSGKTTLFKAIIGTAGLSKGSIEKASNLKIGYVPQQINIDRTLPLTVERFLLLAGKKGSASLVKAFENIGTKDLLNAQMSKLSEAFLINGQMLGLTKTLISTLQVIQRNSCH